MADGIDALLGLGFGGENDEEYTRALAGNLRGDVNTGDMLSLSTIGGVSDLGKRQAKRAMGTADKAGVRRQYILKQALAEKNRREQQDYDRKVLQKAESFTDAEGNRVNVQRDAAGVYQPAQGLDGMTPYKAPRSSASGTGGSFAPKKDRYGNYFRLNDAGSPVFASTGDPYSIEASRNRFSDATDPLADQAGELKRAEKYGSKQGEAGSERLEGANANIAANEQARDAYQEVLATLKGGAWTGPIDVRTPTFRPMSAALESAGSKLTLDLLTKYKLTPVSDKDIAVLRQAALPEQMEEEELTRWVEHKIIALQRAADAEALMADYLAANDGRAPQGEDRARLKAQAEEILYGDGFDPFDPFDNTLADAPKGYDPEDSTTWTRPDDVTEAEWASFSDEDKAMLMGN